MNSLGTLQGRQSLPISEDFTELERPCLLASLRLNYYFSLGLVFRYLFLLSLP